MRILRLSRRKELKLKKIVRFLHENSENVFKEANGNKSSYLPRIFRGGQQIKEFDSITIGQNYPNYTQVTMQFTLPGRGLTIDQELTMGNLTIDSKSEFTLSFANQLNLTGLKK